MTTNPHEPGTGEHAAYSAGVLKVRCERLECALREMTELYVSLVNSGDCGHWDPEETSQIVNARALLAQEAAQ